jgi:hypothetical protein
MHTLVTYKELNDLHQQIEGKLRSTVQDAIRAGELLTQAKDDLPHGAFLPWIGKNCVFSERTAHRYLQLYKYRDKTVRLADLHDAYKQVKQLESAEKHTERQKSYQRVGQYKKTGIKPDGWKRGTDDTLVKEEQDRDERIRRFKESADAESRKSADQRTAHKKLGDKIDDAGNRIDDAGDKISAGLKDIQNRLKIRETFKEQIRISSEGKDSPFVDALIDYLQGLDDDNRRLEACHNIIKVAKSIAKELDRKVYSGSLNED